MMIDLLLELIWLQFGLQFHICCLRFDTHYIDIYLSAVKYFYPAIKLGYLLQKQSNVR